MALFSVSPGHFCRMMCVSSTIVADCCFILGLLDSFKTKSTTMEDHSLYGHLSQHIQTLGTLDEQPPAICIHHLKTTDSQDSHKMSEFWIFLFSPS